MPGCDYWAKLLIEIKNNKKKRIPWLPQIQANQNKSWGDKQL